MEEEEEEVQHRDGADKEKWGELEQEEHLGSLLKDVLVLFLLGWTLYLVAGRQKP